MRVVSNAGPLIALARIGRLDLLPILFGEVWIPEAVRREVAVLGRDRPGAAEVNRADWLHAEQVRHPVAVELLRERLGAGESEAIVLAVQERADLLLIDEARGRRVAESRGLPVLGTVGLLVVAKGHGLVPSVRAILDELEAAGFRMGTDLREQVLRLAGE